MVVSNGMEEVMSLLHPCGPVAGELRQLLPRQDRRFSLTSVDIGAHEVGRRDARLAYVAVTRARRHLDLGGLSWIESHLGN